MAHIHSLHFSQTQIWPRKSVRLPAMAPAVINRLPLVSNLLKWFKGDELIIDNLLFKLHQVKNKCFVNFCSQTLKISGDNLLHPYVWNYLYFSGESFRGSSHRLPGWRPQYKVRKLDFNYSYIWETCVLLQWGIVHLLKFLSLMAIFNNDKICKAFFINFLVGDRKASVSASL